MSTVVYPYVAKVENKKIIGWQGAFDNSQDYHKYGLKRPNSIFGNMAERSSPESFRKGSYVYCGVMFPYYGHFILESLSSLPYTHPDDKLVFSNLGKGSLLPWQKEILDYIDITDKVILVNQYPIEFEYLRQLPQSSVINAYISPELVSYTSSIRSDEKVLLTLSYKKIYVSRSKVSNANAHEEIELESYFSSIGFVVIHPEHHSFEEQVSIYRSAETIVSIEGSALHTLIFTNQDINLYVIPRRATIAHNFVLQFYTQDNIKLKVLNEFSGNAKSFNAKPTLDVASIIEYFEGEL